MNQITNKISLFTALALLSITGCDAGSTSQGILPPTPDAAVRDNVDAPPMAQPRSVPTGRVTDKLQALYVFEAPADGVTISDHSGLEAPYDLTVDTPAAVSFGEEGMTISESMLATNIEPHLALIESCQTSQAITIEAWAKSDVLLPEERGRLVAMSIDTGNRNFDLANDELGRWDARLRTNETGNNGANPSTPAAAESVSGEMQHIVYSRVGGITNRGTIYIDGIKSGLDQNILGSFQNWNLEYALNVGNEATGDRPFIGTIALIAVYCQAFDTDEVTQNYEAGYM